MSRKYGDPVFSGLPTPRQRRMLSFGIIAGMLTITSLLHYTDPGQAIHQRILDPSSRSSGSSGGGGWPSPAENPARPEGNRTDNNEQPSAPRGGWDDHFNQGGPR